MFPVALAVALTSSPHLLSSLLADRAVVIDFTAVPFAELPDGEWTIRVQFAAGPVARYSRSGVAGNPRELAQELRLSFEHLRVKVMVLSPTKLQILGRVHDGKPVAVVRGTITSKVLKPEQLPKVINPGGKF